MKKSILTLISTISMTCTLCFGQTDPNSTKPSENPKNKEPEAQQPSGTGDGTKGMFWMYTGTNLDFLDGPKGLYFKATVLAPLTARLWIYISGGQNRYISASDSVMRKPFSDLDIAKSHPDSIYIKSGFYKSSYEQSTDNIYAAPSFLYGIVDNGNSKTFLNVAFNFSLQSIKTMYKNDVLVSNTKAESINAKQTDFLHPIVMNNTIKQFNYNMGIGLLHKITTEKFDIRSEFSVGFNQTFYPYLRTATSPVSTSNSENSLQNPNATLRLQVTDPNSIYIGRRNFYTQVKFEGTWLNPGISVGFEAFIRTRQIPLFNISLTKVLDLQHLGSLFGKVTPAQ